MRELEGSLKIISNAGVLQYICKGIAVYIGYCGDCGGIRDNDRVYIGVSQKLLQWEDKPDFQMVGDCLHRSISEYTVAIMDFCLRGVLSLPEVSKS